MDIQQYTSGPLTYYQNSSRPSVLILSGMHGDEYGAGKILEQLVSNDRLIESAFLYIPQVSPSAVAAHTRENTYGHDINREFRNHAADKEALAVMDVLKRYHFTLAIDVHEDPERTKSFYIYDTGNMTKEQQTGYQALIEKMGVELYTGMDDSEDKNLGCHVENGYISFRQDTVLVTTGFLSIWMTSETFADRVFTVEIPGNASSELKRDLLLTIIRFLVSSFGVQY